jgi:tetratricopeptide (TPR) repeat protein
LLRKSLPVQAIAEAQKAIEIEPKNAKAHNNLGLALAHNGLVNEAIAQFQRAISLDPKLALPHENLGDARLKQDRLEDARIEYQTAIGLDPALVKSRVHLGNLLLMKGRLDEALTQFHQAIELDPNLAQTHGAMGQALLWQGKAPEAQGHLQRCLALLATNDPQRELVRGYYQQCEQMLSLEKKLTDILKGESRPDGVVERLSLAQLCHKKNRYGAAARFYTGALSAQPKLADDPRLPHRYNAACATALVAAGQGVDAMPLNDEERSQLRQRALNWLQADLTLWRRQLEKATPQSQVAAKMALRHWQQDTDLVSLRDPAQVKKLPEAERVQCRKLWDEVAALLKK